MPHVVVEYSANLRGRIEPDALVECVHRAALRTGVFPVGGTRTRAAERASYRIADGHPDNAFVHVVMRIAQGRDLATRRRVGEEVFAALGKYLQGVFERAPLGISLEIQEIDPEVSWKKNNLHEYVQRRESAPRETKA
ncbi:MAG: 5-carboxymethyl-2-hydroxymuconate Delta-isomerase [Myxococcales bacterium]